MSRRKTRGRPAAGWKQGWKCCKAPVRPACPYCTRRCCQHPAHEAGAVKRGGRTAAAPHIGIPQILFCFCDNGGKGFVLHCRGRDLISLRAVCDVLGDVLAITEQLRLVAQHRYRQGYARGRSFPVLRCRCSSYTELLPHTHCPRCPSG